MTPPPTTPPRQRRSTETMEAILRAAAELLADKTFDQLTIQEITQRAGASMSSFYARFGDKKGLLHEMHRRYAERGIEGTRQTSLAFIPGRLSPGRLASLFVMTQMRLYRDNFGLIRAVLIESYTDDEIASRARGIYRQCAELLGPCVEPSGRPSPGLIDDIETAMLAVKAVLDQEFNIARLPGPASEDGEEEVLKRRADRLRRIFLACMGEAYGGVPGGGGHASAPAAEAGTTGTRSGLRSVTNQDAIQ